MELFITRISLKYHDEIYLEVTMKKLLLILFTVLLSIGMMACDNNEKDNDEVEIAFSGTIIEINDNNAVVEPFEGELILKSSDKINIDLNLSDVVFEVGDSIKVYYDGTIMESYPAQVNVLGLEKIK